MNNGMGFDEWNDGEILFVLRRRADFSPSIPLDRNNNQTHELFARIPVNFSTGSLRFIRFRQISTGESKLGRI